ncbi:modular serine protease-like isoform X4 [Daktulosphaira vitifoliae]|uniref:modular serine protease-like isoform X4 n=1 Tax=Daktulosphaira vitifoliae TaxID=58002 RepID=UPI0021A9D7BB|nr:modular serine protease-like isoform X4 [Daktulosphaira vitifoliae]
MTMLFIYNRHSFYVLLILDLLIKNIIGAYLSESRKQIRNTCPIETYECSNGDCIDFIFTCDGKADCSDNSDETESLCSSRSKSCPGFAFRCSYGACVSKSVLCDGTFDCIDKSDENNTLCYQTKFQSTTYQTIQGKTINILTECQSTQFQCDSGECIDSIYVCDGTADCQDGTDETEKNCENISKTCTVLNKEGSDFLYMNYSVTKFILEPITPNTKLYETNIIKETCKSGYNSSNTEYRRLTCKNGNWYPNFDEEFCLKNCPFLTSKTLDFECKINDRTVDCSEPLLQGTSLVPSCKADYHLSNGYNGVSRNLLCGKNGLWSGKLYECEPQCGIIVDQLQPLISNGKDCKPSEVPWNVGVYYKEDNVYSHICSGSLISQNLVVSAAHCFYDENLNKTKDKNYFQIYVGKYHRNYDSKNENQYAKNYNIETIHIGEKYEGSKTNYSNDIAILVLSKPVNISPAVSIVCVDWNNEHPEVKNSSGLVAGWGKIDKFKEKYSDTLLTAELPFINNTSCKIYMRTNVTDHICAGSTNVSDSGVQQGDSGSGLSFQHKGSNWKIIAGHKEGQTQVDIPSYDSRTWWCHPIDIHYSTKGIQGWPKFHVQIYHYDRYGRSEIYGYGFCYVPTSPGTHTVECYTWRPIGSWKDEFRRFFLGGGAQLKTPDFVYCGTDRYRLQTEALGVVHFELNIIARNFRKYGVEL